MEGGRGLLADIRDGATLKDLIIGNEFDARVDCIYVSANDTLSIGAFLVRLDGVVAWATKDKVEPSMENARAALEQCFGLRDSHQSCNDTLWKQNV